MKYVITDLVPVDGHKSFYGKAVQIQRGRTYYLKSYNTIVCAITPSGKVKRYWDGYSATTARHIKTFLALHNLPGISKKDWFTLPLHNIARDYYRESKRIFKSPGPDMTWQESLQTMYARRATNNY